MAGSAALLWELEDRYNRHRRWSAGMEHGKEWVMPEEKIAQEETGVDRRDLLRRGGAVLAGMAGLGVAGVAGASSATAAPGDPVLQGLPNDASPELTRLTSSSPAGTIEVANTATGAPLRLAVTPGTPADNSKVGDYYTSAPASSVALPTFTHETGTGPLAPALWGYLYTDIWATQPIPVLPQRALDTRSASGRARVTDPVGKFDSAGRLLAGRTITLDLTDFVFAPGAVFGNITVTGPLAAGFVSVYPSDPRPPTSSINFVTGQTIANFSLTGMSAGLSIRIFASATTHVIFDVTAFAVGSADFVNPAILPTVAAMSTTATLTAEPPEWFKLKQARRGAAL
jgi:hypothetical protein